MRIGDSRGMVILDSDALLMAAGSIGIGDDKALTAYLGMEVTRPASLLLIATVLAMLPVTLASVVRVVDGDEGIPLRGRA